MNNSIWRVEWCLNGTTGPVQYLEFPKEEKAMDWAQGLINGGAEEATVTELIVCTPVRITKDHHPVASLPFH